MRYLGYLILASDIELIYILEFEFSQSRILGITIIYFYEKKRVCYAKNVKSI